MHPSRLACLSFLLAPGICFALDITTTDGVTYQDCKITKVEPDALKITHLVGLARIPYEKLPKSLQDEYFDPEKVAVYRKQNEPTPQNADRSQPPSSADSATFHFHHENILGTSMDLKVFATHEAEAKQVEALILAEIERLRKILSTYDPESDISKVNASEDPVPCAPELIEVLGIYESWTARSNGAYNGHIGELVRLWKEAEKTGTPPDATALGPVVARLSLPGWTLDQSAGTVQRLNRQNLNVDSLGKGYIIGKAVAAATSQAPSTGGIFLNIGGDILAWGTQGPDTPWKAGVANPLQSADNAPPLTELNLGNHAISTSGSYQRGFTVGGKRYSHILNPLTGLPADGVASATVIADNPATSNALATTLCVLPPDEGLKLVQATPGTECLIVTADGKELRSPHFASLEVPSTRNAAIADTANPPPVSPEPAPAVPTPSSTAAPVPDDPTKWPPNHKVTINLSLKTPTKFKKVGPKVKDPNRKSYVAIWATDSSNKRVRTVAVWGNQPKHIHEHAEWWKEAKRDVPWAHSVSRATRSPGQYRIEWDGLDDKQNPLPQGNYTLYVEVTREYGDHEVQSMQLSCGKHPSQYTLPATSESDATVIVYGPDST
jgi:FAD:protein FMN transferase